MIQPRRTCDPGVESTLNVHITLQNLINACRKGQPATAQTSCKGTPIDNTFETPHIVNIQTQLLKKVQTFTDAPEGNMMH